MFLRRSGSRNAGLVTGGVLTRLLVIRASSDSYTDGYDNVESTPLYGACEVKYCGVHMNKEVLNVSFNGISRGNNFWAVGLGLQTTTSK